MRQVSALFFPPHLALPSLGHGLAAVDHSGLTLPLHAHSFTHFLGHLYTLQSSGAGILCASFVMVLLAQIFSWQETFPLVAIAPRLMVPMSVMMERFRFSRPFVVATIRRTIALLNTKALLRVISMVMVKSFWLGRPLVMLVMAVVISDSFCERAAHISNKPCHISKKPCICRPLAIAIGRPRSIARGVISMMTVVTMECLRIGISFRFSRPLAISIVASIGQLITYPIALGMMAMAMTVVMEGFRF